VDSGVLERRGSPPFTRYAIAGSPEFEAALAWFQADHADAGDQVCDTRDRFAARLSRFLPLGKGGVSEKDLALIISIAGEVGNNSFDHNLGQWEDVPGCWFEIQVTGCRVWVLLADRGQGIPSSLAAVAPHLASDQDAIETAFRMVVSGRAPERRGNGLKFVRSIIESESGRGLGCRSATGQIHFGELGEECSAVLAQIVRTRAGTITVFVWETHEAGA
jgi:hypothetical protein